MQDKMSLFSLLNPNDIDSGASASARSSPDPITPNSVASLPETWTPATRWSSLHRRNESFESTASSSSNQSPVALEPIRFPPFNDLDNNSRQLAMRFKVEPLGAIAPRQRPVSYNSDKRALKAKTGINKFHVFEYSFQLEGEDKKWYVMWDYRLGLVRFTPFFKCLKYNKTAPARMVNVNPGLDSLKHNITGGSISAQGYWIPYHCARELATKFCYQIAGALIPIFGPTFPRDCLHPSNPEFEDMVISQETIRAAELDTRRYLDRQLRSRRGTRSPAITSHPHTPHGPHPGVNEERSRVEGRWSEPPGTSLEMASLTSHNSYWPSRPGTQDGSSPSGYMTTPRPTPKWSHSYYPSPQGNSLPPLRDDLSLPPLRTHLQQLASQDVDMGGNARMARARDMGTIDPRLLGVEDEEASLACCEDTSAADQSDGDVDMEVNDDGEESTGLAATARAAEILLSMRYEFLGS